MVQKAWYVKKTIRYVKKTIASSKKPRASDPWPDPHLLFLPRPRRPPPSDAPPHLRPQRAAAAWRWSHGGVAGQLLLPSMRWSRWERKKRDEPALMK
jgi:hypothetical protein